LASVTFKISKMKISQILNSISIKEWRFVIFLVLGVIFITTIPLIYGWLITPVGQSFSGIHFAALNDWFVYYSYLEQARQGSFLFRDLFTAEPSLPVFNPFWLAVGLGAKIFHLSNLLAFNLFRIVLIPLLYFVVYLFLAYLFSDILKRKISLLLLTFSGGFGFFLINQIIKYPFNFSGGQFRWPMDLWVPEFDTFLTVYYSPHFIASLILILFIFLLTALFVENQKLSYAVWAGISSLILFLFHPFHILTIFSVILAYFGCLMFYQRKWLWQLIWYYLILATISAPAIFYYLYLLKVDEVMQQKALQNNCFTTPFWLTIFSYGLVLVFAIFGAYFLFKKKKIFGHNFSEKWSFIILWAVVSFILIYSPVNYQRRLSEGLHFPLVILMTVGLFGLYQILVDKKSKLTKRLWSQRYTLLMIISFLLLGSNIFILAVDLFIYTDRREISYLDNDLIKAASWLRSVGSNQIIFNSANNVINIIPAYAGRLVYVGHGVETPNFKQKQAEVNWFFAKDRPDVTERDFLLKRNINYLFYGPDEQKLGNYNPVVKPYLKAVYANSKVTIYQVLPR